MASKSSAAVSSVMRDSQRHSEVHFSVAVVRYRRANGALIAGQYGDCNACRIPHRPIIICLIYVMLPALNMAGVLQRGARRGSRYIGIYGPAQNSTMIVR